MALQTPQSFTIRPVDESEIIGTSERRLPFFDPRAAMHVVFDLAVMAIIMSAIAIWMWGGDQFLLSQSVQLGAVVSLVVVTSMGASGLYGKNRSRRWPSVLLDVMRSTLLGVAVFSFAGFFVAMGGGARRWLLYVVALWTLALCLHHGLRAVLRTSDVARRVIIAGAPREAVSMRTAMRSDRRNRYKVVGFVLDRMSPETPSIVTDMALGSIDELPDLVDRHDAHQVVFCLGGLEGSRFAPLARELNQKGVDVALTGLGNVAVRRVGVSHVQGRPIVSIAPALRFGWRIAVKRTVDVVVSVVSLVVLSPLLIAVAAAIRIFDGHAPIFKQDRVGKGGDLFQIYKFRSMITECDEITIDLRNDFDGPIFKMERDPRTTRIGRFIRKTSIDELPQLVNVFKGDMSLVGPRPFIPTEVAAAPMSFRDRELVTPGMTGHWQVSGRSDTDFDQLDELDRWYVDNWSLGEDLQILAKTVPAVLLQRGAR